MLNLAHSNFKAGRSAKKLITVLLLTAAAIAGCDKNLTEQQYLERAKQQQDEGNLRGSVIELKNALRLNPDSVEGRWMLGNIYLEVGDGAGAEKELSRAAELGIPAATARVPLARAYLLQGQFDRVLKEVSPAQELSDADNAWLHAVRGQAHLYRGEIAEAAGEFDAALQKKAGFALARVGQAQVALAQNKREEARAAVQGVVADSADSAEAWSLLGDIELASGGAAKAEEAYGKAVELHKYPGMDLAKRAAVRIQLQKYPEAEADIKALKKAGFKDHPYVNYIAGINYFRQAKYQEALTAFEASDRSLPSSLPTEMYLATTHYILGHLEQARDYAGRVQSRAPQSLSAKRLLGAIDIDRAQFDAAGDVLQTALRESPNDPAVIDMLAKLSLLKGDTSQGVKYYQRLVSLQPGSSQARSMLMTAKLLDGESLDESIGAQDGAPSDAFSQEFLRALEAFRDKNFGLALERAQKLREQYPDKVDPIKLVAACHLALGQWDKAKVELEKAIKLAPGDASSVMNLAKVEAQAGNLKRAKSLLTDLVKNQPANEQAALLLAEVEGRLDNNKAGVEVLEQVVQSNAGALAARAKLAEAYLQAGNPAKVLEVTRGLTSEQLKQQPALFEFRGKAQMLTGDPVAAKATFEQWVKAVPESAAARFYYGDSLALSGDAARARKELDKAIQLDPSYLPARIGEIKMLVQAGDVDKAKKALAKLKQDFGARPEVLSIDGWFALGVGDYAAAEKTLADALKQRPNTELAILHVRALWAQKKHDQALKTMQAWLKDHPQDIAMLLHQADAYLGLNRANDAIPVYARIVELNPNHVPSLNNLAWLSRDKDLKKAIEHAKRAYDLAPNDPYVLDTFGMLTLQSGDVTRASRLLEDAAKAAPADAQIQLHYGRALIQQKRPRDARKVLEALIKRAPESPSAQEARTLLDSMSVSQR